MDNKKSIEDLIFQQIDPNGAPGSILAENHRDRLTAVLKTAGKYTGTYFLAEKNRTTYPSGTFSWNDNSMDQSGNFEVIIAKKSSDLLDLGQLYNLMQGEIAIQFKDYVGRVALYRIVSISPDTISTNDVYRLTLQSIAGNPSYIYQDDEKIICGVSFLFLSATQSQEKITVGGVEYLFRKKNTGTPTSPQKYDIAEHGVREITEDGNTFKVVQTIMYNSGTPGDLPSWEVILENEISF